MSLKFKIAGDVAQWECACLACVRPWVPSYNIKISKKLSTELSRGKQPYYRYLPQRNQINQSINDGHKRCSRCEHGSRSQTSRMEATQMPIIGEQINSTEQSKYHSAVFTEEHIANTCTAQIQSPVPADQWSLGFGQELQ